MADDIDDDFTSIGIPRNSTTTSATSKANGAPSGPKATAAFDRGHPNEPKKSGVVQPKPQAISKRSGGTSSIIVSPRQKGNPILNNIKSMPWEYGDIPADYVLGATTCALFLSLKYHRLHPEYIYTRIRNLQGKYNLRIILTMVDIQNHEESLKELSKTSLINNVTLVLCWSAAEGGRYLELFKTYENAAPTSIKQHQSNAYSDRMVDFITTPRSINKTDAVSLVSQFGTLRTAVNARHEEIATIAGWGEKKVQRWCAAVREPFRIQRTARRVLAASQPGSRAPTMSRDVTLAEEGSPAPRSNTSSRPATAVGESDADRRPSIRLAEEQPVQSLVEGAVEEEEALAEALVAKSLPPRSRPANGTDTTPKKRKADDDPLSDGVMAALSKLRKS